MAHQARKRFGQNFLQATGVIGEIMAAVQPARGERFVEIGPGLAAITRPLLTALGQLDAIEIDRDLAARLREELPGLTLHVGDVLEFDFSSLGADLRVVGNLPYNISTPLLFHLAGFAEDADSLGDRLLIDDHGAPIDDAVWALYRQALERVGPVATLIERDNQVPAFNVLLAEAQQAEALLLHAGSQP